MLTMVCFSPLYLAVCWWVYCLWEYFILSLLLLCQMLRVCLLIGLRSVDRPDRDDERLARRREEIRQKSENR